MPRRQNKTLYSGGDERVDDIAFWQRNALNLTDIDRQLIALGVNRWITDHKGALGTLHEFDFLQLVLTIIFDIIVIFILI